MTKYSKGDGKVDSEEKTGKEHVTQLPKRMDHETHNVPESFWRCESRQGGIFCGISDSHSCSWLGSCIAH